MNKWRGLFLGLLLIPGVLYSQQSLLLRQKISIQAGDITYPEALTQLADEAGFSFSYNPDILPEDSLISFQYDNVPLRTIMEDLLGEDSELKLNGNHLVILETRFSKNVAQAVEEKETVRIEGYVRDARTGASIPNKTVYDIRGLHSARTDAEGKFILEIPAKGKFTGIATSDQAYADTSLVIRTRPQEIILPVRVRPDTLFAPGADTLDAGVRKVNLLGVVKWATSATGLQRSGFLPLTTYRPAQLSFLPFVGTNLLMSGAVSNSVSVNVLAGYNGAVSAVELGGLMNIDRFDVDGFQAGGLVNVVGRRMHGAQLAGIVNLDLGTVHGFQAAGIANMASDTAGGMQLAGIFNLARWEMDGLQLAGIANTAAVGIRGSQIAGIANYSAREVSGFQLAGIANVSPRKTGQFQVAGLVNYARHVEKFQVAGVINAVADTISGVQASGILNYARVNNGLQLGLINVADTVGGVTIGLFNFVRHGYNKLEVAGNEVLPMNVRFKFGSRAFYSIAGAGVNLFSPEPVWGYTYGFGHVFGKAPDHYFNLDVSLTNIQRTSTAYEGWKLNTRVGLAYTFRLGNKTGFYVGPVWSRLDYDTFSEPTGYLEDLIPYEISRRKWGDGFFVDWVGVQWIGLEAGFRFF